MNKGKSYDHNHTLCHAKEYGFDEETYQSNSETAWQETEQQYSQEYVQPQRQFSLRPRYNTYQPHDSKQYGHLNREFSSNPEVYPKSNSSMQQSPVRISMLKTSNDGDQEMSTILPDVYWKPYKSIHDIPGRLYNDRGEEEHASKDEYVHEDAEDAQEAFPNPESNKDSSKLRTVQIGMLRGDISNTESYGAKLTKKISGSTKRHA